MHVCPQHLCMLLSFEFVGHLSLKFSPSLKVHVSEVYDKLEEETDKAMFYVKLYRCHAMYNQYKEFGQNTYLSWFYLPIPHVSIKYLILIGLY